MFTFESKILTFCDVPWLVIRISYIAVGQVFSFSTSQIDNWLLQHDVGHLEKESEIFCSGFSDVRKRCIIEGPIT